MICLKLTIHLQTPQRSDSVKKPKIKLNTSSTPKNANGATPQAKDKDASAKSKTKQKKGGEKKQAPKEKLTPEELHARKEVCDVRAIEAQSVTDPRNRRRSSTFDISSSAVS